MTDSPTDTTEAEREAFNAEMAMEMALAAAAARFVAVHTRVHAGVCDCDGCLDEIAAAKADLQDAAYESQRGAPSPVPPDEYLVRSADGNGYVMWSPSRPEPENDSLTPAFMRSVTKRSV